MAGVLLWLAWPGRLVPALVAFLALGLLVGSLREPNVTPGGPGGLGGPGGREGALAHAGRVLGPPLPLGRGCRVEMDRVLARHGRRWVGVASAGQLLLRGACPALLPGEQIRWTGSSPDPGARGASAGALRARADSLARVGSGPRPLAPLARLRHAVLARIQPWRDPGRAVLAAVTLGQRDWLDIADRAVLGTSGTAHLMAISGLHVGLVAALLFFVVRRLCTLWPALSQRIAAPRLGALLALGGTWGFVLVCGGAPSAMRAGFMVSAWLLGLLTWRRPDPWASLALAVLGVTLWDPAQWTTPGCQLSFAAVVGLLGAGRAEGRSTLGALETSGGMGATRAGRDGEAPAPIGPGARGSGAWSSAVGSGAAGQGSWSTFLGRAIDLLRVSAVATLATLPLVAYHFGQVTLVGLVANLIAVPVMCGAVVPLGLVGLVLGFLVPWAGALLVTAAAGLGEALLGALDLVAASLGPLLVWALRPNLAEVLAAYGILVAIALRRLPRLALLVGLGAATLGLSALGLEGMGPGGGAALRVELLAVGDGDAILVSLPDGRHGLVDAPGSGDPQGFAERRLAEAILRRGVRRLDFVVATHGHADHVGGLPAILEALPVGVLWHRGFGVSGADWGPLLAAARRRGTPIAPVANQRFGPVRLEVLGPPGRRRGSRGPVQDVALGENDLSVVLRLVHPAGAVLLAADLEAAGEEALLRSGAPLGAVVLKVAHHGSRSATSDAFLDRVAPAVAVISARAPRRGRPSPLPALGRRLAARGAVPLVTGLVGDVTVTLAPWGITVDTAEGRRVRLPPEVTPFVSRALPRSIALGTGLRLLGPSE